jgi:RHS repeat-associated protein
MISGAGTAYTYDGLGERVMKPGKLYWKGVGSTALVETDTTDRNPTQYILFNGARIARIDPGATTPKYYIADNLGSTALVTDSLGNILNESLFFPYGVERVIQQNDTANNYKFTGKERDAETGLDDFGARYYVSNLGRFMSPDWDGKPVTVPYASFGDPQTLNLYSYVENAPLNKVDADGHLAIPNPSFGGDSLEAYYYPAHEGPCIDSGPNGACGQETQREEATGKASNAVATVERVQDSAAQQQTNNLSNVVENETSSAKPDPNAKPGQPGSAEDLAAGRLAVAEVANRVIDAGHPDRVASSTLYDSEAAGLKRGDPAAIDAHNGSRTAAEAALNGSNTTSGATQYRTRVGSNVTTPLGKSKTNPGTAISMHFGPFIEGKHTVVIVVAP